MKLLQPLTFLTSSLLIASSGYALTASDNSANYATWTSGSSGGSGFQPWGFLPNPLPAGASFTLDDSSVNAGNINTSGTAFRLAESSGDSIEAIRSFGGGAALNAGDTFSFDLTVNFRNGNKGFDLRNDGDTLFNFNVGGDSYFFGGVDLGADEGWGYVGDGIYTLEFEFITQLQMHAKIQRVSPSDSTRSFDLPNVALANPINNFKFYVSGTDNGEPVNSLYFNNLNVVPEPGAYALLAGMTGLALSVIRRRRGNGSAVRS